MTEEEEWQERLKAAVTETLRKREAERAQRQERAAARAYGLLARHARKLARKQPPAEDDMKGSS